MTNTCIKCGGTTKPSQAHAQTFTGGIPDFEGETHSSTFSADGPGKLIDCMKCEDCGHSYVPSRKAVAMAYQRFGERNANPNAYIWSSGEELHLVAEGEAHDGSHYNEGFVEVVFDISCTTTAQSLFVALYDHLTDDAGLRVRFHKKTGELKFVQERKRRRAQ